MARTSAARSPSSAASPDTSTCTSDRWLASRARATASPTSERSTSGSRRRSRSTRSQRRRSINWRVRSWRVTSSSARLDRTASSAGSRPRVIKSATFRAATTLVLMSCVRVARSVLRRSRSSSMRWSSDRTERLTLATSRGSRSRWRICVVARRSPSPRSVSRSRAMRVSGPTITWEANSAAANTTTARPAIQATNQPACSLQEPGKASGTSQSATVTAGTRATRATAAVTWTRSGRPCAPRGFVRRSLPLLLGISRPSAPYAPDSCRRSSPP